MNADHALRVISPASADAVEALRDRPEASQASLAATLEPLQVDTDRAAALCGLSPASWFRLKAAGKTPAPVKLGGRVLYRLSDLKMWVSLGCPDRKTFEAHKNANGRPR
jgi:predicted DNA-binding transcriptional regulator AlpA